MTPDPRIERGLPRILENLGSGPDPDYVLDILARTASMRQRPGWLARVRGLSVPAIVESVSPPRTAWRAGSALTIVIVAVVVGAIGAGTSTSPRPMPAADQSRGPQALAVPSEWPVPNAPALSGLVAFDQNGDIFVGDLATGTATAIVTGPAVDSLPMFSPDGMQIAFLRGAQWMANASLLVVRADGSDERVVVPPGSFPGGFDFIWTPNGASLLINHDSPSTPYWDGQLSLVDASGTAEPRLITPPLPIVPGASYFGRSAQVAPMFRPPNGDLILSQARDVAFISPGPGISVWDADLKNRTLLEPEALKRFAYQIGPGGGSWSPGGSMIAVEVGGDRSIAGLWVMNADGSDARRLGAAPFGADLAWSPDGTKIAVLRGCPVPARQGAVIVILDVASGAERVLEATAVDTKYEGSVTSEPPGVVGECSGGYIDAPWGRAWDYEEWSWSPDSRSILMLERHGTRPVVIDVETDRAIELPWEADSAVSWRRVAGS